MKDAFDTLERDLRRAVRARRRRRARRALTLAVATLLLVAGVATSQIARTPEVEREAPPPRSEIERVLLEVVKATSNRPECRPADDAPAPRIAQRPLSPRITAALPALAEPVPGADPQRAAALLDGSGTTGTIVSQSVRTLAFAGGQRLTVFVLDSGQTLEDDPEACAAARREEAAELASGELLEAVERALVAAGRVRPGRQFLYLGMEGPPGSGSSGFAVEPELRTGIVERGGIAPDPRRYVGIVSSPRVAEVRVDPARGRTLRVRALDGFYVFLLEPGAGRTRVTELDANGERIRGFKLPR